MARSKKVKNDKVPFPKPQDRFENQMVVQNGLSDAILGFNPGSIGVQLSQVDTLFRNERWYLISNMRQLLSEMYVEHGVVQTIVDVPIDDGLRGGIEINSKQLSEDQIQELKNTIDREDDLNVVGQALKWNRLFGGAGVIILTDQPPEEPLDLSMITKDTPLEFRAVDMWELFWDKQNTEGYDPTIQEHGFEYYSYYGIRLHKSRVMRMKGLTPPSFIRPRLRGWGFSVCEALVRSINQYLKNQDLTFEVLDEFKLDIFKIKNLSQTLLSPDGTQQVRKRIQLANQQKNYQNAMTMDAEDDYIQKQLSFAGIADILKEIRMQIACDMRMPITKIFGTSAVGFSSGEDDIEVYNGMVESQVRSKCKYDILRLLEIRCQKLFGFIPDDLSMDFIPLRVLSAEQEENVKTLKFNRLLQARQAMEISSKEFKEACNKDNLLSITLDTSMDSLSLEGDPESQGLSEDEGAADGDEGANREDSQKSELPGDSQESKIAAKEPKETKQPKEVKT